MLNRTNRTLSAHLNRLNLGTRSLVATTGESNGKSTLHTAHAHAFAMRDGMLWSFDPSIRPRSRIAIPTIPGSSLVVPGPAVVSVVRPTVPYPDALSALTARPAEAACLADADQTQPEARSRRGHAKPGRKPLQGKRPSPGRASVGARIRAAGHTAAARTAAAGG